MKIEKNNVLNKRLYNLYIKSYDWNNRKNDYINGLESDLCEVCYRNKGEDVHHQNYKSLDFDNPGSELDEDLLYVCKDCHNSIHTLSSGEHSSKQEDMDEGLLYLKKINFNYIKSYKEEKEIKIKEIREKEEKRLEEIELKRKKEIEEEKIKKQKIDEDKLKIEIEERRKELKNICKYNLEAKDYNESFLLAFLFEGGIGYGMIMIFPVAIIYLIIFSIIGGDIDNYFDLMLFLIYITSFLLGGYLGVRKRVNKPRNYNTIKCNKCNKYVAPLNINEKCLNCDNKIIN